jgi:predicted O-methyltransferase YrrM
MFSKVITYGKAVGIITKNMFFWSPSTYHKSQRFMGEIIQYDLVNRYSCFNLKQIPITDIIDHFDIESIKLKEFKGTWGGVSLTEILLLCWLAQQRRPRIILEIGTFQGITTLNLALNSPAGTKVLTVNLPVMHDSTRFYQTDPELSLQRPRSNLWKDYGVENKITQILSDTAELAPNQLPENIDMIFIDGSHSHEYVSNDTELALNILSPKGMIVWHDYDPLSPVHKYLNELANSRLLTHIIGTTLVLFESV